MADPNDILPTYAREAAHWANTRDTSGWEAPYLAAALDGQAGARVLDLGCGTGRPIAGWFADQGAVITGVDGAAPMLAHFRRNLPQATAIKADMTHLALNQRFDVILAWDSFFHLGKDAQRKMFPIFAAHAAPGARLLINTGHAEGEPIGQVGASPVYHASLTPDLYRTLLARAGFEVIWFRPQDPEARGRSIWLARAAP